MQLIVCVKVCKEKFLYEEFKGSDHILALVKSGSFSLSDGQTETVVKENQATIFWGGKTYYRKVLTPVTIYLFRFQSEQKLDIPLVMKFQNQERLASTFALLEKLDLGNYAEEFKCRRILFEDIMMQYTLEQTVCPPKPAEEPIQKAIDIIKNSLHKKIRLAALAKAVNLSYVYFSKRFKLATGVTLTDYIAGERTRLACEFLLETTMNIKDIAAACGFENEYYFSNFFRKQKGISPSEFRKNAL